MSATENLSGGQFPRLFHGSTSELRGTHLQPGGFGGASGGQDEWAHLGQSKQDFVSASDSETTAWNFAYKAAAQMPTTSGRPRVYEVEPHPDTKIGIEHVDHPILKQAYAERWWKKPQPAGEHVAPEYRVVAQHDTMPGQQGTFPSIDWRKHAVGRSASFANHAQPEEPEVSAVALGRERKAKNAVRLALHDSMPKLPGLEHLPTKRLRFDL